MFQNPRRNLLHNRLPRAVEQIGRGILPTLIMVFTLGFHTQAVQAIDQESSFESILHNEDQVPGNPGYRVESQTDAWEYETQSGDTLDVIAARFQVRTSEINTNQPVPTDQLLDPGQILVIQRPGFESQTTTRLLPDSEVVYSPSAYHFDTRESVNALGGFLSSHQEYMRSTGLTDAAEIIERAAVENSIHPRLLLALLEYQCGCLTGTLEESSDENYLMGVLDPQRRGLYRQLGWTVNQLSLGYYGWRQGLLHNLLLADGSLIELPPDWNAGSAALAYLFSQLTNREGWYQAMDPENGFIRLQRDLFSEAWAAENLSQEIFSPGLSQPDMILPFELDHEWSFTSGPHPAWETEGALAALDFAPASDRFGCEPSNAWVLAAADGLVVRSENNALVLDLDGDGFEGTGWALLYMHLADFQQAPVGTIVQQGDPIGHPSCEGGPADGTHVHIARKYNGEWIAAAGPIPFTMDGWVAQSGYRPFDGSLVREGEIVLASPLSPGAAFIFRSGEDLLRDSRQSRDLWWEE